MAYNIITFCNMASSEAVFAIPELLETFLLEVDMKTLLLCQAINKTFYGIINSSIKLQRKLYFIAKLDHGQRPKYNPLLEPNNHPRIYFSSAPAFVYIQSQQDLFVLQGRGEHNGRLRNRHSYKVKKGSWQRMLLAQPPRQFADTIVDTDDLDRFIIDRAFPSEMEAGQTAKEVLQWMLRRKTPRRKLMR
ncbi:auxilin-like clathrin-binding protein required for normal clathrin function [Recurvomyces mirabilis]|uniref:Auxilin-like clathrin-binding protein required for normal clathrin function n=1 Tax=Recurvomyces mirabilis TaxID=574656 RepID=A0AAE0WTH2_9PEZI|nr:auxilin-like clathrin-binding protein required for normal clathrin function [Recurvomyces mirabilis]KAK5160413.1 hypothetical protein LTS14_001425 [Recurvomyces mirabilis]